MSSFRLLPQIIAAVYLSLFVRGDAVPTPDTERSSAEVIAEGVGAPWMNFADANFIAAEFVGEDQLRAALLSGRARPVSLTMSDVDSDGAADIIVGYSSRPPFVTIRFANPGHYRNQSLPATNERPPSNQAFLQQVHLVRVGEQPDHIAVGDFDADRHADIVTGASGERSLSFVRGTGGGDFLAPRHVEIPGPLSLLRAADVNRRDLLADLVVGVGGSGASVLIYQHHDGALADQTRRTVHATPDPVLDAAVDQLDGHYAMDLAVATRKEVIVFSGRDRSRVNRRPDGAGQTDSATLPEALRWSPANSIAALSTGDFVGDRTKDLVVIDETGELYVYDVAKRQPHRPGINFPELPRSARVSPRYVLLGVDVSSRPKDDLLILDRLTRSLNIVFASQIESGTYHDSATVTDTDPLPAPKQHSKTILIQSDPVSVTASRVNRDGLDDIILLARPDRRDATPTDGIAVLESLPRSTFVVDVDAYTFDNLPGDGICADFQGNCSLKAAIREANDSPGPDKIEFAISTLGELWGEQIFETLEIDGSGPGRVEITSTNSFSFAGEVGNSSIHGVAMAAHAQFSTKEGGHDVYDNYFGTDVTGMIASSSTGVMTIQAPDIVLTGNVIAVNIAFEEPGAVLSANLIGVNRDDTEAIGRGGLTLRGPVGNRLGAHNAIVTGNVIAAGGDGFTGGTGVLATDVDGLVLAGNSVGISRDGQTIFGAPLFGLEFRNATGATITDDGENSSAVAGAGVRGIRLSQSDSSIVERTTVSDNADDGISVYNSRNVVIGGRRNVEGNRILFNGRNGLHVDSDYPVEIQGNLVGAVSTADVGAGNFASGMHIEGRGHIVGNPTAPQSFGNVIGGNGGPGISIRSADSVVISGNYIGTNETLQPGLGNQSWGVEFESAGNSVQLGGPHPGQGNVIAFNELDGIYLSNVNAGNSRRNPILSNAIFENGGLGINIRDVREEPSGVNPNDTFDDDIGSNGLQNYPDLSVNANGSVRAHLSSAAETSYRIELFGNPICDESGFGEGREFVGVDSVTTDTSGIATANRAFEVLANRRFITATATDPLGNTSEFSNCVEVAAVQGPVVRVMQDSLEHVPMPIANTTFDVGVIQGGGPTFTVLDTQVSDDQGYITLKPQDFTVGDPFFLITYPHSEPAKKGGHQDVDNVMYRISVDNLLVNNAGTMWPDTLDADTTVTYLGHTTLSFNLTVGIEWPASDAYIENLKNAFRFASNYLYDVSNGQTRLGSVAIYDARSKWDNVDLRIYAANTRWPTATPDGINDAGPGAGRMQFPPVHFGREEIHNVDLGYSQNPLDPAFYRHYSTLIHEFGHYAFDLLDEYEDENGNEICRTRSGPQCASVYNFGFMDKQMREGDPASSEMSAFITTPDYERTKQFSREGGGTSWEWFRNRYRRVAAGTRAEIHTPELLRLPATAFVLGPNDNLAAPDVDVGAHLNFVTSTTSESGERIEYLARSESGNPLAGVYVEIERDGGAFTLLQGKTVIGSSELGTLGDRGKIRLLGAMNGDLVNFSTNGVSGSYSTLSQPVGASGKSVPIDVMLREMAGKITMLAGVRFETGGDLTYETSFDRPLGAAPSLRMATDGLSNDLSISGDGTSFEAALPGPDLREARFRLEAPDSLGEMFFVKQGLSVFAVIPGAELQMSDYNLEIAIDSSSTGLEKLAVLSQHFPHPTDGLPGSTLRASEMYSIREFPVGASVGATLKIYYDADSLLAASEQALSIYRWDGTWSPVPTSVNVASVFPEVTASISQPGIYAAFMDVTQTTQVSVDPADPGAASPRRFALEAYPNPTRDHVKLAYDLPQDSRVRIDVHDVLGRRVMTLMNEHKVAGRYETFVDLSRFPSGVYFVTLDAGRMSLSRSLVLLR